MLKNEKIPQIVKTRAAIEAWFESVKALPDYYGYDPYDLFYWENRVSRWAGNGFSGSAIKVNKVNIFNSTELLKLVLQIPRQDRLSGRFSRELIEMLCPSLAGIPFNPPVNAKDYCKKVIKQLRGYAWLRYLYTYIR